MHNINIFELIIVIIVVFFGSVTGTAFIRRLATEYGWASMPCRDRWHKEPTALHGGVGFYPVYLIGSFWILARTYDSSWLGLNAEFPKDLNLAVALLLGSLIMFLLGLWDDIRQFRPATKFVFQLIAASLFMFAGGVFPLTGVYVFDILATYFWFVGITNAVNMLDNMDGLSSGVVILASATFVVLAIQVNPADNGVLAIPLGLIFISALLGFWVHNKPPASIFMGDSGSLFIGYVLAALAIPSPLNNFMGIRWFGGELGPIMVLLIPATVLAIPIFDTTLVTITRKWNARKATQGGRDHSSHRLVVLGLSEKKTIWTLYFMAAIGGAIAILMQRIPGQSLPLFVFFVLILILSGIYLGHIKVQKIEPNRLSPAWTPLVSNILYKRRAGEVLMDTVIIVICFYTAYLLRFGGKFSEKNVQEFGASVPLVVGGCLVVYFIVGIYRGQWRLISVYDLPSYSKGVFWGTIISFGLSLLINRSEVLYSVSVYIIFSCLLFIALISSRLSFRVFDAVLIGRDLNNDVTDRIPVLIYGAGKAGKLLYDEVLFNPDMKEYVIIGFMDDDLNQVGRYLCGLPIKNGTDWSKHSWHVPPEIWVSSNLIHDKLALQLAGQLNASGRVRRLKIQMDPVLNDLLPGAVGKTLDRATELQATQD